MVLIMGMMVIIMNRILNVVKTTFEKTKDIKIFTLYEENNNIYGIYCNSIEDILRFSSIPDISFKTDLEGHNIFLFELGNVLYNIYNNASSSLFFVDMLLHKNELENDNEFYQEIINFISENIPFFLVKAWLIEHIDLLLNQEDNDLPISQDQALMNVMHISQLFIDRANIKFDVNFIEDYIGTEDNQLLRVEIYTELQKFKQILLSKTYHKISEGDIAILDNCFINFQLMNIEV